MSTRNPTICVMAKAPVPGTVKTRLAATIGSEAAATLARAFLGDTLELAAGIVPARVVLVLAGALSEPLPPGIELWTQGEGDLGQRLERCLSRALEGSPAALVIGTDSPGLAPERLREALGALDTAPAVLGPAEDGGFYLLGLRRCPPELLADLPWSSADTATCTEARLCSRGFEVAKLAAWFDVDTPADLERLGHLLRLDPTRAPRTAALLRDWVY